MNRTLLITLAVIAGLGVLTLGVLGLTYMSVHNTCVSKQTALEATKQDNKNNYDNFWKSVKEVAQVPGQYSGDMQKVYQGLMEGRYKDKNPLMNWIQEQNPNFDSSLYKQVQQVIEAGRKDFAASQKSMIDKARDYKTYVTQMPTSFFARLAGYPTVDFKWSDYEPVTSGETEDAFNTRKDKVLNVFDKGDSR